jgi:hypothetical protein
MSIHQHLIFGDGKIHNGFGESNHLTMAISAGSTLSTFSIWIGHRKLQEACRTHDPLQIARQIVAFRKLIFNDGAGSLSVKGAGLQTCAAVSS